SSDALSLHDALPIYELRNGREKGDRERVLDGVPEVGVVDEGAEVLQAHVVGDRVEQIAVGERDPGGVGEREEAEKAEEDEERRRSEEHTSELQSLA